MNCSQIPETPLWLLSQNRTEDAQKSLQWLRGWVSPKAIEKEFAEVQRYSEFSKACADCVKSNAKCPHPSPTAVQKLKELTRKRTLKPFMLLVTLYIFTQFSGMHAMRPYIVLILKAYGTPIRPSYATIVLGLTGIVGTTTCVITIKIFGKRKIFLFSLSCICLIAASLSKQSFCSYVPCFWFDFFVGCCSRCLRIYQFTTWLDIVQLSNKRRRYNRGQLLSNDHVHFDDVFYDRRSWTSAIHFTGRIVSVQVISIPQFGQCSDEINCCFYFI